MPKLSLQALQSCNFTRVSHNLGRGDKGSSFTKVERVIEFPRLKRVVTIYSRHDVPDEMVWFADGVEQRDLAHAIKWITGTPIPVVSIVERTVLDLIGDKWQGLPVAPLNLESLIDKGMVEMNPDGSSLCRCTALAREYYKGED